MTKQDSTLVGWAETQRDSLAQEIQTAVEDLRKAQGDRPADHITPTTEQKARAWLPEWFVKGQAHPDVSGPWWKEQMAHQEGGGPLGVYERDIEARKLYRDPKYALQATLAAHPDLLAELQQLRMQGLHTGGVLPTDQERKGVTP